jgi:intron-binding protein aquarius
LSRARLGLYILGRREVFESCYELREAFQLLLSRPDKLHLVTGELYPSKRILAEEEGKDVPGETIMEGVEHLGQYVFQMSKTRIEQLKAQKGLPGDAPAVPALEQGAVTETVGKEEEEEAREEAVAEGFEAEEE